MHDVVVVGIPLLVILAGILLNRAETKEVRAELAALRAEQGATRAELLGKIEATRSELLGRMTSIEGDLRQFYHLAGKLEGRVDALEKQR